MPHVRFTLISAGLSLGLFVGMVLFLELGRRIGARQVQRMGPASRAGLGVVDNAAYGLLALLLGFTFAGAASRFDHRRELVIQEVNSIGTAWDLLDMLPAETQPAIRAGFQRYLDAVLAAYSGPPALFRAEHEPAAMADARQELWKRSVAAILGPGGEPARMLLMPELNEMFDIVERERLTRRVHPPRVIYGMLAFAALAAALFGGYGMATAPARNWIYIIGIAAMISVVTYVILELEFPRAGLIRVDSFDQALVNLRATMK